MKSIVLLCSVLLSGPAVAQTADSLPTPAMTFSAYLEPYYSFVFNTPDDHNKPGFIYSHNRHNEFNLNLGFVKAAYTAAGVRANLALMAGTYANANLAAEPGVLKNVFEANAGVRLARSRELWLDVGIFPSHIGFESAIGKDNATLTRSIVAENSPYYESGARLSYTTPAGRWYVAVLALNGWQRIARPEANNTLAGGAQITWKPADAVTLNYSTFLGNDKPDTTAQMRIYHNLYGIFAIGRSVGVSLGFDYGMEASAGGSDWNTWYTPVAILRVAATDRLALNGRMEYYDDENGVIIATGTRNGFKTLGYSLGLDYAVHPNALWRLEARSFRSKDAIFSDAKGVAANRLFFVTTAFTVSL